MANPGPDGIAEPTAGSSARLSRLSTQPARLSDGHAEALAAMDTFFGAFCLVMTGVAAFGWWRAELSLRSALVFFGFVVFNAAVSFFSYRSRRPYRVEVSRLVLGGLATPAAYLLTDGPFRQWWPAFLIMVLGQGVGLGLLTQRPLWGSLVVIYYLTLMTLATLLGVPDPDWYHFILHAGVIAMVGLMWAQVMSLLGRTLRREREQAIELAKAHDALFAEIEVAQKIQTLLLPRGAKLTNAEISGYMLPAAEVGGDYYDVIVQDGRRTFLAIGDVSGHGVTSGLTMMMARSHLLGVLEADPGAPLGAIYDRLNRALCGNLERMGASMYMTFALIEILDEGRFAAVGQHPPPLLYRHKTGQLEEIELKGIWLGVRRELDPEDLEETRFTLTEGDSLVLYTDGIIEHRSATEMFGMERFKELLAAHAGRGSEELVREVFAALRQFAPAPDDDMTLLVLTPRAHGPAS